MLKFIEGEMSHRNKERASRLAKKAAAAPVAPGPKPAPADPPQRVERVLIGDVSANACRVLMPGGWIYDYDPKPD